MQSNMGDSTGQEWSLTPPEDYNYRFSVMRAILPTLKYGSYALAALFVLILTFVFIVSPNAPIEFTLLLVVLTLIFWAYCAWRIYAEWWAWQHFGIKIEGATGVMEIIQKGPWILGLPSSSNDTVNLADQNITTPKKRHWWERVFGYDTLTYGSIEWNKRTGEYETVVKVIGFVENGDHITAIQKFVRKLPFERAKLETNQRNIARLQLEETRRLNTNFEKRWPLYPPRAPSQDMPAEGSAQQAPIVDAEILDED